MVGQADEEGLHAFLARWTVGESISGVYFSAICVIEPRISGDEEEY